ncbi:PDR/VanB family oxidoreductase [Acidovorax sp. CCYZU-2555]|uniref:PDR/VanB family oxidoreductase n=1 Tax=Acidovorax sp. CCYZU-2555 TaxID=2835042 RepID=UPI001BCE5751|nr:PDR/VanB family oxidoreductase [Acidovorax sp. CCYZU-2555]MBS7781344.1 oxidoreductase [Acidovorax sp. CCYZU-2555]
MQNLDTWLEARVGATRDLTPSIREFRLDGAPPGDCPPGAHVNVRVLIDGRPDYRSYSVTRQQPDGSLFIAVKRPPQSRGGSAYMWSLAPGSRLQLMPPACDFALRYGHDHYLLIAGGIGITPIYSMAMALARRGASVRVLYAARSADEFAFQEELQAALGSAVVFFCAQAGQQLDIAAEIAALPAAGELYVCGPIGLMEAVKTAWSASRRAATRLHFETFGSSGRHATQSFTVHVPRLGLRLEVPTNKSMLDALTDAGMQLLSDCRRGECGLCAVDILELQGELDHRDVFFSAHEHASARRMCACVSRVAGGEVCIEAAWRADPVLR